MALFGKREVVFKTVGSKERWKAAKATLKEMGIKIMEAGSYESEAPMCGCGAKIDRRNYGPNGWIDRRTYYISVRPEDVERARAILRDAVGNRWRAMNWFFRHKGYNDILTCIKMLPGINRATLKNIF